jgi:hypothetical protein
LLLNHNILADLIGIGVGHIYFFLEDVYVVLCGISHYLFCSLHAAATLPATLLTIVPMAVSCWSQPAGLVGTNPQRRPKTCRALRALLIAVCASSCRFSVTPRLGLPRVGFDLLRIQRCAQSY